MKLATFLLIAAVATGLGVLWLLTKLGGGARPSSILRVKTRSVASPAPATQTPAPSAVALKEHQRLVGKIKQDTAKKAAPMIVPSVTVLLDTPNFQHYVEPPRIDKDAWEGQYMADYAPGMVERTLDGVSLNIKFVDREGSTTQRDITVKRYAHNPSTHGGVIYAWCHLRQGNRPFALQRIRAAIDLTTGEVIQDVGAFLDAAYQESPLYAAEMFLKEHHSAIVVLFSFSKADGAMRVKERAIIKQWAVLNGLTQEQDLLALESKFKHWTFSKHSFYHAVKTVKEESRSQDYMQSLWEASQAIVASDKTAHSDELQLLSYAARLWGLKLPEYGGLEETKKSWTASND